MDDEMRNPGAAGTAAGAWDENKRYRKHAPTRRSAQRELKSRMLWANSFSRWPTFASFIRELARTDFDMAGYVFWRGMSDHWSGMDRIDHFEAWLLIDDFQHCWSPTVLSPDCRRALARLPAGPFPIYRGQSARLIMGNSWTTDPAVAAWFAKNGIRGSGCPDPVVLVAEITREDVALALDDRNEAEVVPLIALDDEDVRMFRLADFCAAYGVTGERPAAWAGGGYPPADRSGPVLAGIAGGVA